MAVVSDTLYDQLARVFETHKIPASRSFVKDIVYRVMYDAPRKTTTHIMELEEQLAERDARIAALEVVMATAKSELDELTWMMNGLKK